MSCLFCRMIISHNLLLVCEIHIINDYGYFIHWPHISSISRGTFTSDNLLIVGNSNKKAFLIGLRPSHQPCFCSEFPPPQWLPYTKFCTKEYLIHHYTVSLLIHWINSHVNDSVFTNDYLQTQGNWKLRR